MGKPVNCAHGIIFRFGVHACAQKKHPKRLFICAVSGPGCWGQCGYARHRRLPRPCERAGTRLLGGVLERHQGRRGGRSDNDRGHAAVGDIVAPFAVVFPVITCEKCKIGRKHV